MHHKIIIGLLSFLLLSTVVVAIIELPIGTVSAFQDGDYGYSVSGSPVVATVTRYYGSGGAVSIPSTLGGYDVVAIGASAFEDNINVTRVTIPNNVTSIGDNAFWGCTSLTSVTMPDSVTTIGNYTFYICYSLTSATIPRNVTSIGAAAFSVCTSLTSVTIPRNVTSIGEGAFYECNSLTSIDVNSSNPNYASIDGVFYNKANTTLIKYPGAKVGPFTIPSSVTNIEGYAFTFCYALTSVTIPSSVTSIGNLSFAFNPALTSVTIPSSVTSIGNDPFGDCNALISISIGSGNPNYNSIDGVLYNKAETILIQYPGAKAGAFTIPNSVTSFGDAAFSQCIALTSVTIPSSVNDLGNWTFDRCTALTSVTIPSSVNNLGNGTFSQCSALTSMIIPSKVTEIGQYVFQGCTQLKNITFNGNAPLVGTGWATGCTNLTIYYYEGAAGFTTPTWNGVPTSLLSSIPTPIAAPSLLQKVTLPLAAGIVGSGLAILGVFVVGRVSESMASASDPVVTRGSWFRLLLRRLRWEKIRDFIVGYLKHHAKAAITEKAEEKLELRAVAVKRESVFAGFSGLEIIVIIFASVFLGMIFMIVNKIDLSSPITWLTYILVGGLAVIAHDLAHRYVAWRYDVTAEYQFWFLGTIIMFVTAFFFGTVFSSPSKLAVNNHEKLTNRQKAMLYASGPIMSFGVAIIFLAMIPFGGSIATIGVLGATMNLLTATYAMMPFHPMAGHKVYRWKRPFWAGLFIPMLALYFALVIVII